MDGRRELKCPRLRGNHLEDLDGFGAISSSFNVSISKVLPPVGHLKLEDVGYNFIAQVPPELGCCH